MPRGQRWKWIGRHLARLYPLAFAVIPALHTVAYQPGKASLTDLAWICIGLALAFGLCYVLIAWAIGPTWLASLCVVTGVAWFYGFPAVVRATSGAVGPWVVALAGGVITAAAVFWLRGRPETLDSLSRLLGRDRTADGRLERSPHRLQCDARAPGDGLQHIAA
jgi:hypothetical protein